MSGNTIDDLRNELFAAMRGLTNKQEPLDIERAKAVAEIGQVIINSAKVEVSYLSANGSGTSAFLGGNGALPAGTGIVAKGAGFNVTRHRLRG